MPVPRSEATDCGPTSLHEFAASLQVKLPAEADVFECHGSGLGREKQRSGSLFKRCEDTVRGSPTYLIPGHVLCIYLLSSD